MKFLIAIVCLNLLNVAGGFTDAIAPQHEAQTSTPENVGDLESKCRGEDGCPAFGMHPQVMCHTHGGLCSGCNQKGIDVCFEFCNSCAKEKDLCPGCGKLIE